MGSDVVSRWAEGQLSIELVEDGERLRLEFGGKSSDREPGRFIMPVLQDAIERARATNAPLVLDFSGLEYMNSSTFTPVVKSLGIARAAGITIVLQYSLARKWQALSFSALRTFETLDGRIQVQGR
jgi:hypothetical protein